MKTTIPEDGVRQVAESLGWWSARLARARGLRDLGAWGEWIALHYLRRLGWDVVARNWKGGDGELDLVAFDGPYLVAVEVKTRLGPKSLPPENQVNAKKTRRIDRLALQFILRHELAESPLRLDVIAVETDDLRSYRIRHYTNWQP
jgi:putative endonuclease